MKLFNVIFTALAYVCLAPTVAIDLDVTSKQSICDALTTVCQGVMSYYDGYRPGGVIGMFVSPYYWWEAGEAWGGLVNVWHFCGNTTFEHVTYTSLMFQRGDANDYIPSNQSTSEGNDDQGFWGIAAMDAAERNFTNPPSSEPGWLALVQAVVATMNARWDTEHCGGGLRWQIFTWNNGYNYKNTVSNGCLFHLAARLARYTNNETYVQIAEKTWDWLVTVDLVNILGLTYNVYDGATTDSACKSFTQYEWTYNYGLLISGAAYLYSHTNNQTWLGHVKNLLTTIEASFFKNKVMYERACEDAGTCNNDQKSFKSVFSRFLSQTAALVPDVYDDIRPLIVASAQAAAKACTGPGNACGVKWTTGQYDGETGLGQQISAMEVITSLLATQNKSTNSSSGGGGSTPLTNSTGGSSVGNNAAGAGTTKEMSQNDLKITLKDKIGAGITTAVVLGVVIGGGIWMLF